MPVDNNLQWNEIRDFTPGKWSNFGQLMPPNAAQVMTDCYPLPTGGLRAWYKAASFPTTGIVSTTNELPRGMWVHELLPNRSGVGTNNDYYLVTFDTVSTFCRIYRMDQTAAGPPVSWTLIKTTAAGLDPGLVYTCDYVQPDGQRFACFGFGAAAGVDNGIWIVRYSDASITHLSNLHEQIIGNYQSRFIAIGSVADGESNIIKFTDPGTTANFATNKAPVDVGEGTGISGFAAFSPGDLIVFKGSSPIYLVEGDLTNYTVRQMNGSKMSGSLALRGPEGVIFLIQNDGVYMTPDGSYIMPLSKPINSGNFVPQSSLVFHNHWLFYSRAGGQVMDYDTRAWFDTSIMQGNGFAQRLAKLPGFMFSDNTTPFTLWTVTCVDNASTSRAESWTWKSSPLRDPSGRQVEIRAVQVVARSFNGATSTIAVTVNGNTQTVACDSAGRGSITFYFRQRREVLDVQVVAASNQAGVQAPDIEVVRLGSQPGHFLRQVADVG